MKYLIFYEQESQKQDIENKLLDEAKESNINEKSTRTSEDDSILKSPKRLKLDYDAFTKRLK
jgi:hypothetical protein